MLVPLMQTLLLALENVRDGNRVFVGLDNFRTLFGDPRFSDGFWNALRNNVYFFVLHMLIQNPIGIALAALLSVPRLRGGRALPHGAVPADHPVLRDRRLPLEAPPVAALGASRRTFSARSA